MKDWLDYGCLRDQLLHRFGQKQVMVWDHEHIDTSVEVLIRSRLLPPLFGKKNGSSHGSATLVTLFSEELHGFWVCSRLRQLCHMKADTGKSDDSNTCCTMANASRR
jgi:hypothetical protein